MCKNLLIVLRMFNHSLILILIITSLAIHYSQNVFRGFSILVCIGVQVFFRGFFFFSLLLSRVSHSRTRLALASVRPKNAEKLRLFYRSRPPQWNYGFIVSSFLSFFISKRMVKTNFFFYKYINIQIRRFFSELVESKSCGKYCLIIIRIGTNTALLAFSLGM